MKVFHVKGHIDDGYTTHDSLITALVIANDIEEAKKVFIKHCDDGWNLVYNVSAEEVPLNKESFYKIIR